MKLAITGGHHSSALPLIDLIQKQKHPVEIFWIGHKHTLQGSNSETLEYKEISAKGLPFFELKAGKFYRTYNPKRLLKIPFGFFQAFFLLKRLKPDLIMSYGGYLAVPVVIAGKILGIPSLTHEQTVVAGYANKVIARFAKKIFISWEQSLKFYPRQKVIYAGLPLREYIFKPISSSFEFNNNFPVIYITGGKTGSHIINTAVLEVLPKLLNKANLIIQSGDNDATNDFELLVEAYKSINVENKGQAYIKKFIFENEIGEVYSKANLIISRSGAHTTGEILALGKPAILIPIPWVSHNEQYLNAKVVVEAGQGRIIEEKFLTPEKLLNEVNSMLDNLDKFTKTGSKMPKNKPAQIILDEILKYS